jgi:hypothetical protein
MSKMKAQRAALVATTGTMVIPMLIQQKASLYAVGVVLLPHVDPRASKQLKKDLLTMKKQVHRVCGKKAGEELLLMNTGNVMLAYKGAMASGEEAFSEFLEEWSGTFRKGVVSVLGRKVK